MANRKTISIICPICGRFFDIRGHHNHVEKCIRINKPKSKRKVIKRNPHHSQ